MSNSVIGIFFLVLGVLITVESWIARAMFQSSDKSDWLNIRLLFAGVGLAVVGLIWLLF